MEVVIGILAVIAGVVGILGSILPALPGPPLSWVGMLLLYFWGGTNGAGEEMSLTLLLVWLGITVAVTILDYVVPAYFTKVTGGSKYASIGGHDHLLVPRGLSGRNHLREKAKFRSLGIRIGLLSRLFGRDRAQTHCLRHHDVLYHRLSVGRRAATEIFSQDRRAATDTI